MPHTCHSCLHSGGGPEPSYALPRILVPKPQDPGMVLHLDIPGLCLLSSDCLAGRGQQWRNSPPAIPATNQEHPPPRVPSLELAKAKAQLLTRPAHPDPLSLPLPICRPTKPWPRATSTRPAPAPGGPCSWLCSPSPSGRASTWAWPWPSSPTSPRTTTYEPPRRMEEPGPVVCGRRGVGLARVDAQGDTPV